MTTANLGRLAPMTLLSMTQNSYDSRDFSTIDQGKQHGIAKLC